MPISDSQAFDALHENARATMARARSYFYRLAATDQYTNSPLQEIVMTAFAMALLDRGAVV
jgi:hypothetical protein